jgi:hypothetical protein
MPDRPSSENDRFLDAIDARIAALQQLRTSYLAALATGALGHLGALSVPATTPAAAMPVGDPAATGSRRAHGSIAIEVERVLNEFVGAMTVRRIAAELRQLGLDSVGGRLEATITSTLHRLKARGRAVRTEDGWMVGPGRPARPAREKSPRPPRPRRPRSANGEPPPDRAPGGMASRIEDLLRSQSQPWTAHAVADALGEPLQIVGLTIGRLVRQRRIEKDADGRFALAAPAAHVLSSGDASSSESDEPHLTMRT